MRISGQFTTDPKFSQRHNEIILKSEQISYGGQAFQVEYYSYRSAEGFVDKFTKKLNLVYLTVLMYQIKVFSLTGEGLVVASQPKWGKHRRVINKAFHRKAINSYRSKIVQSCRAFTEKLQGGFLIAGFCSIG